MNNLDFIDIFEKKLCGYTGFKYAVCVDCCTNAIVLSFKLKQLLDNNFTKIDTIIIPTHTYMSVPMTLSNYGYKIQLKTIYWKKFYALNCVINNKTVFTEIFDAATDLHENMKADYIKYADALVCVSFQQKKRLPLGRGGVIFTNNKQYYLLLKRLRYDGRNPYLTDSFEIQKMPDNIIKGYHMYMEPDKAVKGILLINQINTLAPYKQHAWKEYSSLIKIKDIL